MVTQKETPKPHISRHHKKWDIIDKKGGNRDKTKSRTYVLTTLRSQIYQTGRSI